LFASFVTVCSFFFNYALKFCEKKVKDVDKVSTPQTGVFIVVTVEKKNVVTIALFDEECMLTLMKIFNREIMIKNETLSVL